MEGKITLVGAMMYLQDNGIFQINIRYSGEGDSGAIDAIEFYDNNNTEVDINCDTDVNNFIENLAYSKLNGIEDWYNNDGGYGNMTIEIPSGEFTINNNIRITDYEVYTHEGQLESED